jgi:hypothetical protein
MASKLKSDAIKQSDIEEYLNDYSDFSFELRVLKELTDLKLECQHGGTYEDPVTGKSREFDIRALMYGDESIRIHLSVECKNIRDNFPLVVHCIKRKKDESYHELVHTYDPKNKYDSSELRSLALLEKARSITEWNDTPYLEGAYVAKSADQVGRRHDGTIEATDGGVFEKISQAINSSRDLIDEANDLYSEDSDYLTFICPVLVVPDSTLWQVNYSDDGARIASPVPISHISYFIGKVWSVGGKLHSLSYSLSHLEIVTFSEIKNFVGKYLNDHIDLFESLAPEIFAEELSS